MTLYYPDEFARRLSDVIGNRAKPAPTPDVINEIVSTSFFASMEQEEHRDLAFAVAYVDDEELRAKYVNSWIWCPFEFVEPRAFGVDAIVKVAPAIDPRRSFLAISGQAGDLRVVGVVRTTTASLRMHRGEASQASLVPWSALSLRVPRMAHLLAFVGNDIVMSFRKGEVLDDQPVACFRGGLLFKRLYQLARQNGLDGNHYHRTVQRVVTLAAERGHGGTIIIHPATGQGLSGGYPLRLGGTNLRDAVHALQGRPHDGLEMYLSDHPPQETDQEREAREARASLERELVRHAQVEGFFDDATNFAADLTGVDGALVLRPDLTTYGFGVRLNVSDEPTRVVHAQDLEGERRAETNPIEDLGTRHTSAARFCSAHHGTIGFVVSEDGPVTLMIRPDPSGPLLVWRPVNLLPHANFQTPGDP